MRLIDADALYYKVKCECNPYGKPTIDFESGNKVLDWIEKAQTIERPQWIPCSERLPEKNGRYIVTEKRFSIDDRKHNGWYQTIVEEVIFSSGKWDRAKFFEIVAWMPLPKPYKESENNEQ